VPKTAPGEWHLASLSDIEWCSERRQDQPVMPNQALVRIWP
jgi:hypothetical protein